MLIEWNLLSIKLVQNCSYTTPVTFLLVTFERMTGSKWYLLQKCYVFVPVLCMSNFLRSQQRALSGTCLHRAGVGATCRTCGPLDRQTSHDFFLWDYLKKRFTGINIAPRKLWRVIIYDWRMRTWRLTFGLARRTTCNVGVTCVSRKAATSSNTLYKVINFTINSCMFLLSFIWLRARVKKL